MRHLILSIVCLALVGCGLDQTLHRSDKPLSLAAASKDDWVSFLPFPASTSGVYYLWHSGGMQEYDLLVRFTIDPKDLDRTVSDLLLHHDKETREHHFYTSASIADSPRLPALREFEPMPWWSPDSVTNGFYHASTNGQPFAVWADVTHHTIYLWESD